MCLCFFHLAAKRLMAHLPSSSWVNTTEGPCWLLHAVTWEWGSTVVLTRWIWTPQWQACHSANHSICLETQYGRLGCVLEKTPGEPPLASQLSLVALSLLFIIIFFSAPRPNSAWSVWGRKWAFMAASELWSDLQCSPKQFSFLTPSLSAEWFMTWSYTTYSCCFFFFFLEFSEWVWLHDNFFE